MRTPATLFVLLALSLPAAAQAPADAQNAQTRPASGFHAVEVANGIDLFLRQGPETVVVSASTVEGRDRILTTVEKGVLRIWYDRPAVGWGFGWRTRQLRAYVSAPTLNALSASGGSDIRVESTPTAKVMGLDLSGGSDFQGSVAVDSLATSASGGSDLSIAGRGRAVEPAGQRRERRGGPRTRRGDRRRQRIGRQ